MWMSEARIWTAFSMIRLTRRMTGALSSSSAPPPPLPATDVVGVVDGRVGELLEHRVDRLGLRVVAAVVAVDRLDDRLLGGQGDVDLAVQDEPELVERLEVHRVMHDDLDGAALLAEGHDDVLAGERLGDELDDRGGDLDLAEVDEVEAVLLGLGLGDLLEVGVAEADEGLLDARRPCRRPPGAGRGRRCPA